MSWSKRNRGQLQRIHMKKNTIEKVYLALRDLEPRLEMTQDLLDRARVPIDRMLALSA